MPRNLVKQLPVELEGPCPQWHSGVQHARVVGEARDTARALVLLGTRVEPERAAAEARRAAMPQPHPNILRLRAIQVVGTRAAWVYDHLDGLGLGHVTRESHLLPTRAAAELVGRIAETLNALGPSGLAHPGPEPNDVLLTVDGDFRIAGFTSPFPPSPSMRAPDGSGGESALVYRLGVLLAHLLTGYAPTPASDPSAHEALARRAVLRTMARPGPAFNERYADWLRGMLAWRADTRPPLSSVAAGLREVAAQTSGPTLKAWCNGEVPRLLNAAAAMPALTDVDPDVHDMQPVWPPAIADSLDRDPLDEDSTATAPGPLTVELPERDDPTIESSALKPLGVATPRPDPATRNHLPVAVGPPPEAVRPTPALPPGFLEGDHQVTPPPPSRWRWLMPLLALTAVAFLGAAIASVGGVGLALLLFW